MRILVTNDDGIDADPLHVLARRLTEAVGVDDVVVVAPDQEYSGSSASIGTLHLMHPEVHRGVVPGIDEAWAVCGPPALGMLFARLGAFGPVDLVVSGINPGVNVGRSVYHSGTVGAATTARSGGLSAVAVSQSVDGFGIEGQAFEEMMRGVHWDTAAEVAARYVEALITDLPDEAVVVNLNVPNEPLSAIKGWRHGEVGLAPPRTVSSAQLVPKEGHEGAYRVDMDWGDPLELPIETDGGAVEAGYVSVTHLSRFAHAADSALVVADRSLDDLLGTG